TTSGWVSGGWDTSQNGGMDGYVVKLNVAGEHEWSTYLGGAADDCGYGIAVDAEGNIYATGYTHSSGWVSGGWDTILSGTTNPDGYAVKLNTWGEHVWSTYLGANGSEEGYGIAVDADGNCYATGSTTSTGWVSGGWDTTQNGYIDGYVVKLNSAGMHAWSTYFGGNRDDAGHDITVDATGNCLIAGIYSNNGVFGTFTYGYILKITSAGSYQWSETAGIDRAFTDIVVSGNGDCYVIGRYNALTKLNSAGDILFTGTIKGSGIALDSSDFCYVAGCTNVEGWATGGWDTTLNGLYDGFIAKLTSDGTLLWSSYLGGVKSDYCEDIAVDSSGPNIWVTGHTVSPEWVTDGWQTTYSGFTDAFVVKNVDNIPIEGEGEPVVEGEGEVPAEGEGEVPAEGEGEVSVEGEGETSVEGEGELPIEGEGEGEAKTILLPGDVPLDLVWIPEGSFLMGRYPGEEGSDDREDPQHEVTLAEGFWMGKYEVTQEQWLAVRGAWPDATYVPSNSYGLGSTYPAYYISWDDTQDFIASLNAHIADTGQGPLTVRLPTEAEWEYACRAGTQTRFYFGDSLDCAGDCSDCVAGSLPGNRTDYMWYCGNNAING
ncbi:MAG TPA: SBBP repeat-containing protein, partial [Candidatus Hydrogenedentes bacterium]|nr:SBBP repeat-containing protein [Candidatus Hydrogenedentota bacterium]